MTAELDRYQPYNAEVVPITGGQVVHRDPARDPLDGWIQVMADVAKLAEYIADTELVPDTVRRRPAAVAAIILTGREMGLAPMLSLRHIFIVKGKPGMTAEIMRKQVLSAGHELQFLETTDTRCVIRGRRRGESDWLTVTFTAEQARRAKIDLGGYPEDKLVARASSRLCRRKFADCIAGIPTVDELEDDTAFMPAVDVVGHAPAALPAGEAQPVQRTAQRRTTTRKTPAGSSPPAGGRPPAGGQAAAPQSPDAGPPLPGEDGYDQDDADAAGERMDRMDPNAKATSEQNRHMHALFREAELGGKDDRPVRLQLTGLLLNRQLDTSAGLTVADAGAVIDALVALKNAGHPDGLAGAAADLLNQDDLRREAEKDTAAEPAADEQAADEQAGAGEER